MSLSSYDGLEIHFQIIWNATRMILQKKKRNATRSISELNVTLIAWLGNKIWHFGFFVLSCFFYFFIFLGSHDIINNWYK